VAKEFGQEDKAMNPSVGEVWHHYHRRGMTEGILCRQEICDWSLRRDVWQLSCGVRSVMFKLASKKNSQGRQEILTDLQNMIGFQIRALNG